MTIAPAKPASSPESVMVSVVITTGRIPAYLAASAFSPTVRISKPRVVRPSTKRTTLGFEIRTVGLNADAARYAGMRPVVITTLTMTLSGLLAGFAGAIVMLGVIGFYAPGITASVGFDSIAVALLGRSDPLGILFAAILFGAFRAGAPLMQITTSVPVEVIDIIQALVILFLAADLIVRKVFRVRAAKREIAELQTVTKTWGGTAPSTPVSGED